MNVLLALGMVPTIILGVVIGLLVGAAVFGLVFLICILPDIKKGKKAANQPAESAAENPATLTEEENEEEEAVEILQEKVEETSEESVGEDLEEQPAEVTETAEEEPVEETVTETVVEETVEEEPIVEEVVEERAEEPAKDEPAPAAEPVEEVREEAVAASAVAEEEEDEAEEEDDVEDNETQEAKEARLAAIESAPELENNQRYNRSFKARLIQSSDAVKEWYATVKDATLSYKGTRSSLSWRQEKIYKGRTLVAKMALRGKTLSIYFPLSVSDVRNIEVEDVSDKAVHAATPALLRIKKDVHAQQALDLVAMSAEKLGLESGKAHKSNKSELALQTTEQLVEAGLVKIVTFKK